ncbi:DNA-binding response regulator [Pseudomonas alkylphenolica]|uniref:DNA-binding response regulator n=1 Tax=Pseudomonas alkylphenolica TaxID=237609 RepID=A0A443ZTP5_9PSED|nr:response regulator transcription factor [Pseudomonas alkylphenolica]RWU22970.1 DNA-binding response regulator [Pseudomonas alkylphenolica]
MEVNRLKVLIADDHSIVRDGLKFLLSTRDDLEVVGEAAHSEAILTVLAQQPIDVLLLDLGMPGVNRLAFIRELRRDFPALKIIVLTANIDLSTIRGVLDAGVHAYISKTDDSQELFAALDAVAQNRLYLAVAVRYVVDGHGSSTPQSDLIVNAELTARERQILALIAQGASSTEIAGRFCISAFTVRKHRENLMRKLDLHNTAELAAYVVRLGLPSA